MAILQVQWADQCEQLDPCQRISRIGGSSAQIQWQHTHAQAIHFVEQGSFTYYVKKDARALNLVVGLATNGHKYLKVQTEEDEPRLLLNLPSCPKPVPH